MQACAGLGSRVRWLYIRLWYHRLKHACVACPNWSAWQLGDFLADGLAAGGWIGPYRVGHVKIVNLNEECVEAAEGRKLPRGKCAPQAKHADI